jgi:hypothetical protein
MRERLEELADRLKSKQPIAPAALEEQAVRLLAGVLMLLRQHETNKHGQCRFCAAPRRRRFWQRRPQCMVYRSLDFVMRQSLDAVWWQLLETTKRGQSFGDIRK